VWVILAALALVVVLAAVVLSRVRHLARRVGSFECSLRRAGQREWTSGIAVFGARRLHWHRTVSLRRRPGRTFVRRDLEIVGRRRRAPGDVVEVVCRHRGEELELAMGDDALAGLVSWLEAAPPDEARP
jgi:hypothetical protein